MEARLTLSEVQSLSNAERQKLAYRLQTDSLFLYNCVLRPAKYEVLDPVIYGDIFAGFLKPNPFYAVSEWTTLRTRIILSPRGSLKSTIGCACFTSAILADPDIAILIISGEADLAGSLCRKIQTNLRHEIILELFPQYKPENLNKKIDPAEYLCAARTEFQRDPTIGTSTLQSVKGGLHPNIIWFDDVTNEVACANEEMCIKTVSRYGDCFPLLGPEGIEVFTGTRWTTADLDVPEQMRERAEEDFKITGIRSHLYVCKPIWKVKATGTPEEIADRKEREKENKLTPADVDFYYPNLNRPKLWSFYRNSPKNFACQYLMCPEGVVDHTQVFSESMLKTASRPISEMPLPHQSETYANFDLSGVGEHGADSTAGVVAVREIITKLDADGKPVNVSGKIMFMGCTLGRFESSYDLAFEIVEFFRRWNPKLVRLESAAGARFLEPTILEIAAQRGVTNVQERLVFGAPSNKPNAKRNRVLAMATLLKTGVLSFFDGMPFLSEVHKQLTKFTPSKTPKKNDAADSCAQLVEFIQAQPLPEAPETPQPNSQRNTTVYDAHGLVYSGPLPEFDPIPDTRPEVDHTALENELAAAAEALKVLNPYN